MGGRRVPREKTLSALVAVLLLALTGCRAEGGRAEVTSPATTGAPPTATLASATEAPSPTPDPLARIPASAAEARNGLQSLLGPAGPLDACPPHLVHSWSASCATADVDNDGLPDAAWLIPLRIPAAPGATPAVVFFRPGRSEKFEEFAGGGLADASPAGAAVFGMADRDGLPGAEITYLASNCSAAVCTSIVRVQTWDGTAWRDIGPGDDGVPALNAAEFDGAGGSSRLTVAGGKLDIAAGPTRLTTRTYEYAAGRYRLVETQHAPPEYLYHAVVDADALFAAGKFEQAVAAYRALIGDVTLKDWKKESGQGEGRHALEGYARFRIAVATAALGLDPTEAIDAAIRDGKEVVFTIAAQEFRRGFQEHGTVLAGCAAATRYLGTVTSTADTPAYIARLFNYGYANQPAKTFQDICRLP